MSATRSFRIAGLDCVDEVVILKRALGPLVGGEDRLGFDVLAGRMSVPREVDPAAVVAAVARTGMSAATWSDDPGDRAGVERGQRLAATGLSGAFLTLAWCLQSARPRAAIALYVAATVAGGWFVAPKAWVSARSLRPDMNLLMTFAVFGAVGIGEWLEAATVAFLFALSLALEAWSVGRARRAVEALLRLAPSTLRVRDDDGREREVPAAAAAIGTRFVVRPGERVALDGRIVAGSSDIDQSSITGESLPLEKSIDDEVFAGSINGHGALEIESTKAPGDTTLARILRRVEDARSRRAPSEQWVERFARVYTPTVFALALAVGLALPVFLGVPAREALYRALALLVIACPCALVVSTPVAIVASLAAAARHGVLLKGGLAVEEPARLTTVAMDKTGTLTHGKPSVVEVVPLGDHDERALLERVAALEASSEHPLAHAIRAYAEARGVVAKPAADFRALSGRGAEGRIDGRRFWLGSHRLLEERGQATPELHQRIEAMSATGRTIIVVGNQDHVCGIVALTDAVRPEAAELVAQLKSAGIRHVVMLTGDHGPTARAVGAAVGIDEIRSDLLPEGKVEAIVELVALHGRVAMVGDGVNDAPAMARSTLGIAMGLGGSDAAIETADVALTSDDLSKLPWLIRHSRRTLAIIRQNVVFALVVKAAFIGAALAGATSLWLAIAADTGATLLVIANALRLLGASPSR